jgi:hypothetical protein
MRRVVAVRGIGALVIALVLLGLAGESPQAQTGPPFEVVATGVPRPLQVVLDGRALIVLSLGRQGNVAGELYRVPLDGDLPLDLAGQPRVRIPFTDERPATLGSLALHPQTRVIFLGEENGTRVYRLADDGRLTLYATGIHRLGGGSTLAFDRLGRLVVVDYVDPALSEDEERPPPGLEQFRDEDYRGPLVFRMMAESGIPLPRRLGLQAPLFPRAWGGRAGGALLPKFISVVPVGSDEMVLLTSGGALYRLDGDRQLSPFTRLPRGQYTRTHMVTAPDGSIFVSGGFHVGTVFRVAPDGAVTVVASGLADPEGIALDARGNLYVAESSFHRIVRLRALQHGGG